MFAPRLRESQPARQSAAPLGQSASQLPQEESSALHSRAHRHPKWDFGGISLFGGNLHTENARGAGVKNQAVAWNQKAPDKPDAGAGSGSDAPVAATPVAVRNGPHHSPIDQPEQVGMAIAITLTSSTGKDEDMKSILDSEKVSDSKGHTGSCKDMPKIVSDDTNTSTFMAGYPVPDDEHGTSRAQVIDRADNHGGDGQFDFDQLDIFKAKAGDTPKAIPHSGYTIRRIIKTGAGKSITLRTEKAPAAVTVRGFSSEAGPSATQADDVAVRKEPKDDAKDKAKDKKDAKK